MARRKMNDKYKNVVQRVVLFIFAIAVLVYMYPKAKAQLGNNNGKDQAVTQTTEADNVSKAESNDSVQKESQVDQKGDSSSDKSNDDPVKPSSSEDTEVTIWLDSWVWLPIAAANGGNETTPDSEFGKRGLNVHIINNESDDEKAEAFKNGQIDAMAATVNRLSLLSGEFYGNTEYVVPYLLDYSSGGDGIASSNAFTSIESLKDAKAAVGANSVSQVMLMYLYKMSSMSDEEFTQALQNIVPYPSSEEAAQAYLNGEVDAVATWQPFLNECVKRDDSHKLFSTATSSKIIMDALILNKDFVDANPETVELMIDGMLTVVEDLKAGENIDEYYDIFRDTFPEFSSSNNDELDVMFFQDAQMMDWHENMDSFQTGVVEEMFTDMCDIWNMIGAETVPSVAEDVFDDSFLIKLSDKYKDSPVKTKRTVKVDKDKLEDVDALITKSFTVNFKPYTTEFTDPDKAIKEIEDFVKVAKVLDGAIIRLEGNVSSRVDTPELQRQSLKRAEAIRDILVEYGIDPDIIFCYGNGATKQKYPDPHEPEEYEANRSTDGMFVTDEEVYEEPAA